MSGFTVIPCAKLEEALADTSRQYLVGSLARAQMIKHVQSEDIEVGISNYTGGEYEAAHFHPQQIEFQIVLWGSTEYYDISNDVIYKFQKGDFYCIENGVKYAQKILERTRIFFIKVPAINDKVLCEIPLEVKLWMKR